MFLQLTYSTTCRVYRKEKKTQTVFTTCGRIVELSLYCFYAEANLSTQEAPAIPTARLSDPSSHRERPPNARTASQETAPSSYGLMLPRSRRLHLRNDIRRVARNGFVFRTPHLLLRVARGGGVRPRIGFVVSKKVSKHATERNRLKRVLREIVRSRQPSLQASADYLFSVRRMPKKDFQTLSGEVEQLLSRSSI